MKFSDALSVTVHMYLQYGSTNSNVQLCIRVRVCLKMQSGEESSSSGLFNPVGHLQQLGVV